jgi:hypothetical protein
VPELGDKVVSCWDDRWVLLECVSVKAPGQLEAWEFVRRGRGQVPEDLREFAREQWDQDLGRWVRPWWIGGPDL